MLVHSTELILGGVLHQELDLHSYPTLILFLHQLLSSSSFLDPSLIPRPIQTGLGMRPSSPQSTSSSLYCSLSSHSSLFPFFPFLSTYPYPLLLLPLLPHPVLLLLTKTSLLFPLPLLLHSFTDDLVTLGNHVCLQPPLGSPRHCWKG